MQRLLSILLSLLAITVTAQDKPLDHSLLWKISNNGISAPSYLFGTIHAICAADYFWTDKMEASFRATQQLYLELPMADSRFQSEMMQAVMLKDSATLREYFSEREYEILSTYLSDSLHIPVAAFAKLKPLVLLSLFVTASTKCGSIPASYEVEILKKAKVRSLEIKGLETVADQVKIFDDIPKDSLAAMIMSYINTSVERKKDFCNMVEIYKSQNIDGLYKEIISQPDMQAFKDVMLTQRNKRWSEKIYVIAKQKPTFFAIGAAHLSGDDGLINLLRRMGYTVEAVR